MNQNKSTGEIAWTVVRIIIAIGLIGWLIARVDWKAVWPLVQHIPAWSLAGAALLYALSQVVIAIRWYFLLHFQKVHIPFLRLLGLVFVGMFASNFLPTTIGGDVIKMAGAVRGQKKSSVIVASVVADRLYNLGGMVLLLPLSLTLNGISLPGSARNNLFPVLGLTGWPALRERLKRTWQDVHTWFTTPACILPALALSWLSIGLAFSSFWVITLGLGISISYWQASGASLLSYFAALIPLAINGLGIQESSLTYLLGLQGATLEQATAAAFIIRLVTMAVSLAGGLRLLWGWQDLLRIRRAPGPQNEDEQGV